MYNRLHSESPRPDIPDKVADTPDIDVSLLSFLKKFAKDPKKGIDRAWRGCQDKLLDVAGPLTKILEMALEAKESDASVDPDALAGWTQRAICLLGNANCAISTERRKWLLMRMDSNLTELAEAEPGPLAEGNLFGDRFVKEVSQYVGTFMSLDKAQSGIKRVFKAGLFNRERQRTLARPPVPSRSSARRLRPGSRRVGFHSWGTFYPTRQRFNRRRFNRGGHRADFQAPESAGKSFRQLSVTLGEVVLSFSITIGL